MIRIRLSASHLARFKRELSRAGSREVGGVLAAELISDGVFTIADFSVQRTGGSVASFVREPSMHKRFLRRFFQRTGYEYERFNYIGEWHSHPLFPAVPSPTDLRQMQSIADDPEQVATFVVLLIVRLRPAGKIEATAHAFRRGRLPVTVTLEMEGDCTGGLHANERSQRISLRERVALRDEQCSLDGSR
ncbi:Mov34/MPN/PAD-1 family protein [Cupriavidus pinatubonensis]|uniref:JAB domain-containing protein n=1 Tax=Cupriavidus pinatubonensis TaxID=248026 RepID=A0ABM8XK87_9BURK|nr:hypothetical protein LMG23994_04459 [Cupriavidus pinatubonensis]